MRKLFPLIVLMFTFVLAPPTLSFAQRVMDGNNAVTQNDDGLLAEALVQAGHTAREEAEGKAVWEKLQAKELNCQDLSDKDFGALGEYFMGQMAGKQHEAMNNMMIQMMGEEGEEQMHIALGKRISGCEPNAPMPQAMMNNGVMPMMMQMMMGGGIMGGGLTPFSLTNNSNNPMMSFGFTPFGWLGGIFMLLFWALVIVALVVLIKWLVNQGQGKTNSQSALDILERRYAKGEINKKEFEEKKKDLS